MLDTFDSKATTWEGLWYHPETLGYTSSAIDLSKLKQFKGSVRLYVRKNRFYNGGKNGRPNYVFCIKDARSDASEIIGIAEPAEWIWTERLEGFTILEGYECSKCGSPNGYNMTKYCPDRGAKMANGL